MKSVLKKFVLGVVGFCIAGSLGCGGGGGGSSDTGESFAGVWNGVLFLVLNNCPFDQPDQLVVSYLVNQTGNRVVVNVPSGVVYEGTLDGPDGFLVTSDVIQPTEVKPGVFCDLDAALQFSDRQGDEAEAVAAVRIICANAVDAATCDVGYAGVVQRGG